MRFSRLAIGAPLLMMSLGALAARPAYKPGTYDSRGDIFDALYGFKTFNGKSLIGLLDDYGLSVTLVEVDTIESLGPQEGDRPGDVNYSLYVEGTPTRHMPCDFSDGGPIGTHDLPDVEEFIRRKGQFPVVDENGIHPTGALMFWAATGRCSKAWAILPHPPASSPHAPAH